MATCKLYLKAGKMDGNVGDCPFCHKTCMALCLQGVSFDKELIDLANKPKDFLCNVNPKGSVPCATVYSTNQTITDSDDIIQHLCPDLAKDLSEPMKEAINIFPAFVALIKNKNTAVEPELKDALNAKLRNLSSFLQELGTPFLGGASLDFADCKLAPILYHIKVAGAYYKSLSLEDFAPVQEYFIRVTATPEFTQTSYSNEDIIEGWSKFFI